MICDKCSSLALFPKFHQCIGCNRYTNYSLERWCRYCSDLKGICAICGKPAQQTNSQEKTPQIQKIHQSFHTGGCRTCGGTRP